MLSSILHSRTRIEPTIPRTRNASVPSLGCHRAESDRKILDATSNVRVRLGVTSSQRSISSPCVSLSWKAEKKSFLGFMTIIVRLTSSLQPPQLRFRVVRTLHSAVPAAKLANLAAELAHLGSPVGSPSRRTALMSHLDVQGGIRPVEWSAIWPLLGGLLLRNNV